MRVGVGAPDKQHARAARAATHSTAKVAHQLRREALLRSVSNDVGASAPTAAPAPATAPALAAAAAPSPAAAPADLRTGNTAAAVRALYEEIAQLRGRLATAAAQAPAAAAPS